VLDVKVFLVILNTQQAHRDAYRKINLLIISLTTPSVFRDGMRKLLNFEAGIGAQ